MGQLIGILPRNGEKQHQLQNLVLCEMFQIILEKPFYQPLSVSIVDAHDGIPFLFTEVFMKRAIVCSLMLLVLLSLPALAAEARLEGVWVSTVYNLDYPSTPGLSASELAREADAIIENAKSWGLNAIFLQVRPGGDALYPSELQPWSAVLSGVQGQAPDGGFDPLDYFIRQCHREGLELHAWLNPYRVTRTAAATREEALTLLCDDHPARDMEEALVFFTDGCLYLDPGLPQVRQHLLDTVRELLERYQVDGIHLDDYFYPGGDFDDAHTYARYGGEFAQQGDFRRDAVNQLIDGLHRLCGDYDRAFGVSPSGIWATAERQSMGANTTGSQSYYDHFADSRKWVREGLVDYIAPQIYWEIGADAGEFSTLLDWWSDAVEGTGVELYIGLAAYKSADAAADSVWFGADELTRQLAAIAQSRNACGWILFRYRSLPGSALAETLAARPQPQPALPETRWPAGLTVEARTNQSVISGQSLVLSCEAPRSSRVTVLYGSGWQCLRADLCGGFSGRVQAESPWQEESYTAPALVCAEKHGMLFVQLTSFTVTSVAAEDAVSIESIRWWDDDVGHHVAFSTGGPAAASLRSFGYVAELTFTPCRLGVLFRDEAFDHMTAEQTDDRVVYRLVFPDDGQARQLALLWEPDRITLTVRTSAPAPAAPGP